MTNRYAMRPTSQYWNAAWQGLADFRLNQGLSDPYSAECPTTRECWQYMGSEVASNGLQIHTFRHRHHPNTREREAVQVRTHGTQAISALQLI